MLRSGTVEKETFDLLVRLMDEPLLADTRLVGGTSLALQMGHRTSTDIDLFSYEIPDIEAIVSMLVENYGYIPQIIRGKTTIGHIDGIKIDIIYHPFIWLESPLQEGNIRLATKGDIAAMKMHAIANSGERPKDFVDIAYLSQFYSYNQIKSLGLKKYPGYDPIMFDRAINYFGDINEDLVNQIRMIGTKMNWEKIKERLVIMTEEPDRIFPASPLPEPRTH